MKGYTRDGGKWTVELLEDINELGTGRGRQTGVERTRNDGRCRHAAQVEDMSGRGCWGADVDNVQVGGVQRQERRLVAGEIERNMTRNG